MRAAEVLILNKQGIRTPDGGREGGVSIDRLPELAACRALQSVCIDRGKISLGPEPPWRLGADHDCGEKIEPVLGAN